MLRMNHIDKTIAQWQAEFPDLDMTTLAIGGRLGQVHRLMKTEMEKNFHALGLSCSGFDVLATLRRCGKPYTMSPKDLIANTMVTSGTMTNRLGQLEKAGLIIRVPSKTDKRSCLVTLTDDGLAVVEKAIVENVELHKKLFAAFSPDEREQLNQGLKALLTSLV